MYPGPNFFRQDHHLALAEAQYPSTPNRGRLWRVIPSRALSRVGISPSEMRPSK